MHTEAIKDETNKDRSGPMVKRQEYKPQGAR